MGFTDFHALLTTIDLDLLMPNLRRFETEQEGIPDPALTKSLTGIAAEISRLYKVSNTFRCASMGKQSFTASDFHIMDDKGNNVEETLLGDFHRHVDHRFPSLDLTIQDRLARAMLFRRRHILYRKYRQDHVYATLEDDIPAAKAVVSFRQPRSVDSKTDSPISKSATTKPPQINSATLSASATSGLWNYEHPVFPSTAYKQLSPLRDDFQEEGSTFRNAEADREATMQQQLNRDIQGLEKITCRYCLCLLSVEDALDEVNWR